MLDDLEQNPPPLPTEEEYSARRDNETISDFSEKTLFDMSLKGRLFAMNHADHLILHANMTLADGSSTYLRILVDSGASASYIDNALRDKLDSRLVKHGSATQIKLVNGTYMETTRQICCKFHIGFYKDNIMANSIDLSEFDMVLGYDWLKKVNPIID